ncbi:MAG: urease accessory UreF family protein [Chloroflexota bacterium]
MTKNVDENDDLMGLRLLQLADSAIPIGAAAHSFGLETLIEDGTITVPLLSAFLSDYLRETGMLEVSYCLTTHTSASEEDFVEKWLTLNMCLDALKTVRESRAASTSLGRRFVQLAVDLEDHSRLREAIQVAKAEGVGIHQCAAFGLVGGVLGVDARRTGLAYLNQNITGLVSACQRLMPLGQTAASQLLWALKPVMIEVINQYKEGTHAVAFTPMVDIASLRHPALNTRLFIS